MPVLQNPSKLLLNHAFTGETTKKYQIFLEQMRQAGNREDFKKYLKHVHNLGSDFQSVWAVESKGYDADKKEFREYIKNKVLACSNTVATFRELYNIASNLEMVFIVWEDPDLSRSQEEILDRPALDQTRFKVKVYKAERQKYKIKGEIDKFNRHAIHIGLLASCFDLVNQFENLMRTTDCTRAPDYLDSIKTDLEALISSDSKLDNQGLIKLIKRIRSLITQQKNEENIIQEIQIILENNTDSLQKKRENILLLNNKVDSIKRAGLLNDDLLNEILASKRWRHNGVLLGSLIDRIIKCDKDNTLLKNYSKKGVNKKLLKIVKKHVGEQDKHIVKLVTQVIRYINKKEKCNEQLLNAIAKCKKKNSSTNRAKNLDRIAVNERDNEKLDDIEKHITKDKIDNQELLIKIYKVGKGKKGVEKLLKKHSQLKEPYNLKLVNFSNPPPEVLAEIESAVKLKKVIEAISSFKTPYEKFISRLGVCIALLASLSCGVITGGSIFLLLVGVTSLSALPIFSLVAFIVVSSMVFIAGFRANFRFFAETLPKCLGMFTKRGGIKEFIDASGNRKQLSSLKKLLLIPAALGSATVGVSVAAFTFMSGLHLLAVLLPILSASFPVIPAILVGILAITLCIAMSLIMFKAFVGIIKKPFSLVKLREAALNSIKSLMTVGGLAKAAIIVFALFSLYFLCFLGLSTLTLAFGGPVALLICVTSFLGQIPFTTLTVNTFCDLIGNLTIKVIETLKNVFQVERKPPSCSIEKEYNKAPSEKGFFKRCAGFFVNWLIEPVCLVSNAIGNGVLVLDPKSSITYAAGGGGVLNSIAGNLVVNVPSAPRRIQANKAIIINHARVLKSNEKSQIQRTTSPPISILNKVSPLANASPSSSSSSDIKGFPKKQNQLSNPTKFPKLKKPSLFFGTKSSWTPSSSYKTEIPRNYSC